MALIIKKPAREIVIKVQNLRTQFGRTVIHNHLNLSINKGEIISIVGGSGTGKTVLLRQMLRLEQPTRGSIIIHYGVEVGIY